MHGLSGGRRLARKRASSDPTVKLDEDASLTLERAGLLGAVEVFRQDVFVDYAMHVPNRNPETTAASDGVKVLTVAFMATSLFNCTGNLPPHRNVLGRRAVGIGRLHSVVPSFQSRFEGAISSFI
jgi:hypothetical protein